MRQEIRDLLAIQKLDMEIRELEARKREIRAGLDAITGEIEADERIIREEKEKEKSSKVRAKELELEVEDKRGRIEKYQGQLFKVKTNKEYTALIHEIEGLKSDIAVLEDRILELMEEGEGETQHLERAREDLERARELYREKEKTAGEELARLDGRIGELRRSRDEGKSRLDPDFLERYEIIFSRRPDRAVAPVVRDACTGCNMEMTAQVQTDLARDEMVCQCENCGCFIYLPEDRPSGG